MMVSQRGWLRPSETEPVAHPDRTKLRIRTDAKAPAVELLYLFPRLTRIRIVSKQREPEAKPSLTNPRIRYDDRMPTYN